MHSFLPHWKHTKLRSRACPIRCSPAFGGVQRGWSFGSSKTGGAKTGGAGGARLSLRSVWERASGGVLSVEGRRRGVRGKHRAVFVWNMWSCFERVPEVCLVPLIDLCVRGTACHAWRHASGREWGFQVCALTTAAILHIGIVLTPGFSHLRFGRICVRATRHVTARLRA